MMSNKNTQFGQLQFWLLNKVTALEAGVPQSLEQTLQSHILR